MPRIRQRPAAADIDTVRVRLIRNHQILKTNSDRLAAELAKALAANKPRSTRWT